MAALTAAPPAPSLYAHTVQRALAGAVRLPRTEYLVLDLRTQEVLADTFAAPERPLPPGSLLKPFVALAHRGPLPDAVCRGHNTGCWRTGGHGRLLLPAALAFSCNTYFLALASGDEDLAQIRALGLPEPPSAAPEVLIGLSPAWRVSPLSLAEAYARLPALAPAAVLRGLHDATKQGTAAALGQVRGGALGKTGTAPCVSSPDERCTASGDGLAVALAPALHPTRLVLVRRRGTTGAATAATAGIILRALDALDGPDASRRP